MSETTFKELSLDERILDALREVGYETPTAVQAATIPVALEGKDVMATAQTGTGKTASFVLPVLQRMYERMPKPAEDQPEEEASDKEGSDKDEKPQQRKRRRRVLQALILSPTRELAQQIETNINNYSKYLPFNCLSVVGGLPIERQIRKLRKGVDVLVATPGRLLDLMNRKEVNLKKIDFFVLDEADRMLDMGFVFDVQDIARVLRKDRQTLFFSATTSPDVLSLSRSLLQNPEKIEVDAPESVGRNIVSKVCFVERKDKRNLVVELLKNREVERALIFTATKSDANVLAAILEKQGFSTSSIHSDRSQKDRQRALQKFESGEVKILVATDVMARGIHVTDISHVINYDMPNDPDSFVHRVGRTARAGATGTALSLCDLEEVKSLQLIEKVTGEEIEVDEDHSFHSPFVQTMKNQKSSPFARRGRGRASRGGKRRRFG